MVTTGSETAGTGDNGRGRTPSRHGLEQMLSLTKVRDRHLGHIRQVDGCHAPLLSLASLKMRRRSPTHAVRRSELTSPEPAITSSLYHKVWSPSTAYYKHLHIISHTLLYKVIDMARLRVL